MTPADATAPLFQGGAHERGRAQARLRPQAAAQVRAAIRQRLGGAAAVLARRDIRALNADLCRYARTRTPDLVAEAAGVAEGWGLALDELMDFLHLPVLLDVAEAAAPAADGCSAFAATDAGGAVWLGKNRDYRGEHALLQAVIAHHDPAWGGTAILCVGSLGAPGAFSSGLNSHGLALADTQVTTRDHGPGLSRYFLMTDLLVRCRTVAQALARIGELRHAGGGCLVLADAKGNRAAVDLGHATVLSETAEGDAGVARTNHHPQGALAAQVLHRPGEPMGQSSQARLATLGDRLRTGPRAAVPAGEVPDWAVAMMGSHDGPRGAGLCRHGQDGDARTISTALFAPGERVLYYCGGPPCATPWQRFAL